MVAVPRSCGGCCRTVPDTKFLALSVSDAAEDVIAMIRGGARGYVTKSISGPELVAAIGRVSDGDAVFSPRLAGFVLDAFAGTIEVSAVDEDLDRLTEREREVMRLIARGYAYKEVGRRAVHLDQDRRDPHVERAAQASAVQPLRADPLGLRPPPAVNPRPKTPAEVAELAGSTRRVAPFLPPQRMSGPSPCLLSWSAMISRWTSLAPSQIRSTRSSR